MNLDDFDKIPCSAKEAWEWMCKTELCFLRALIVRWGPITLDYYSVQDREWRMINPEHYPKFLMEGDWFKLVPKNLQVNEHELDKLRCAVKNYAEGRNLSKKRVELAQGNVIAENPMFEHIVKPAFLEAPSKCEDCGAPRTPEEHKWCTPCYRLRMDKIIKDGRFEAIDIICADIAGLPSKHNVGTMTRLLREFARALVKLVEETK
jgi:hypothetical protein